MPLVIRQFPCLSDNYGFLVRDEATGETATVDTPDAERILAEAEALGWRITAILNTHWHPDHTGGNARIKAATGAPVIGPKEVERLSPVDRVVEGGDEVTLGETRLQVIASGGHTLGHVAFYAPDDGAAFVGDTLFALGCGRLFEGTPAQMFDSLDRLKALPPETRVYCAHEYTAGNARFAMSVDASEALAERARQIFAARERGEPTVPTSMAAELATNPFLKAPDVESFAALRRAKDGFSG